MSIASASRGPRIGLLVIRVRCAAVLKLCRECGIGGANVELHGEYSQWLILQVSTELQTAHSFVIRFEKLHRVILHHRIEVIFRLKFAFRKAEEELTARTAVKCSIDHSRNGSFELDTVGRPEICTFWILDKCALSALSIQCHSRSTQSATYHVGKMHRCRYNA